MGLFDGLEELNPFRSQKRDTGLEGLESLYSDIELPELQGMNPALEDYLGDITDRGPIEYEGPEYEDILSQFGGLEADPIGRESQLTSMGALQDIVDRGGMNLSDMANMNRLQTDAATADQGRRGAILQNMAARGMGGSGMELLSQLQSSQAATDRASQAGMDQAGMMQDRALQSILARGDVGRQMTGDQWQRDAQKAQAQDAISQFNARNALQNQQNTAQNQMRTGMANRDYSTGIQEANLGRQQQQQAANVNRRNRGQEYNIGRNQQQFDNRITQAGGQAQARIGQAQAENQAQANENIRKGAILGGVGTLGAAGIGAAYAAPAASDEDTKENIQGISDQQLEEFFEAVSPKTFDYKNPGQPGQTEGPKAGFIAQDVEGTGLGEMILRKQEGQPIKYDEQALQGLMLAAITKLMGERNGSV